MRKKKPVSENVRKIFSLMENRHVVMNRLDKSETEFRYLFERIYNHFRHEAVTEMNRFTEKGERYPAIDIRIPAEMLDFPNGLSLKRLNVIYKPTIDCHTAMRTVSSYMTDHITIEINVDFFDRNFKNQFFHEMRHVVQMSAGNTLVYDSRKMSGYRPDNLDVGFLMNVLERIQPMERKAYPEQIFNDAFSSAMDGKDIRETTNSIIKEYVESTDEWKELMRRVVAEPQNFAQYVCSLLLININGLVSDKHDMKLFDKRLFSHPLVLRLRETITGKAQTGMDFGKEFDECVNELTVSELMPDILASYCERMTEYRQKFINMCIDVIDEAYKEADTTKRYTTFQRHLATMENYIRRIDNGYVIEAIALENDGKYIIVELFSPIPGLILDNFNILKNSVADNMRIMPGFSGLWPALNNDASVLSTENFEKANDLEGVKRIVGELNRQ